MNIMNRVTWRAMWKNKIRTLVTILGVVISAAMFMAITTTVYSLWNFMVRGYQYEAGDFYVYFDYATEEQAEALSQRDDIAHMARLGHLGYTNQWDRISPTGTYRIGAVDEMFLQTMSVPLTAGRLPENSSEIVIPEYFNDTLTVQEKPEVSIGDTLTLDIFSTIPVDEESKLGAAQSGKTGQKAYKVVGIMKDRTFAVGDEWGFYTILTVADGNEGEACWHRLYAKTRFPGDASALVNSPYGEIGVLYRDLLNLYGFTRYSNVNLMLYLLAAVACTIILVASVSLIGNAFSISVSERSKQFGLLAGVGATKKQLRSSVLFEATSIAGIGIPIGIVAGFGGIAVVFSVYGKSVLRLFSFGVTGDVPFYAALSWVAVFAAVLICGITILLSAWLPSKRATRVSPIESIRQNSDYKTRQKDVKTGKLTRIIFGLPGMMGKKYYKISRRKYRATVVSLSISIVLLIVSAYFSQTLNMYADINASDGADFEIQSSGANADADFAFVRSLPGIEESVIVADSDMVGAVLGKELTEGYKKVMSDEQWHDRKSYTDGGFTDEEFNVMFMENSVLEAHLRKEGINPKSYLTGDTPVALRIKQEFGGYYVENEAGEWIKLSYYGSPLEKDGSNITLIDRYASVGLLENIQDFSGMTGFSATESGHIVRIFQGVEMLVGENGTASMAPTGESVGIMCEITEEKQNGLPRINYYWYDLDAKQQEAKPFLSEHSNAPEVTVGALLDKVPFGVQDARTSGIILLFPLSRAEQVVGKQTTGTLYVKVEEEAYEDVLFTLESYAEENREFSFFNRIEEEMNLKGIMELVYVFAAGFIILIALISAANVFNTISTNFALRRRDFGMLRSVGMKTGELYRMAAFECINYGVKALLWGLPLSIGMCYGIYWISNLRYDTEFSLPWGTMLLGIACIFAVVFATMLYAIHKLRQGSPIEAIRMENT